MNYSKLVQTDLNDLKNDRFNFDPFQDCGGSDVIVKCSKCNCEMSVHSDYIYDVHICKHCK